MEAHFNSAILLTLRAYGISDPDRPFRAKIMSGPPKPNFNDDALRPSFLGRFATWNPIFTDELRENSRQYGATGDDGAVTLGIDAFSYPGKLASTIYHESIHFKELTTKGSDWMNVPATEVRVRIHTAQFERRIFRLNEADLLEQAATLEANRRAVPLWQKLLDEGFDPQRREHMQVLRGILRPPVRLPGAPPRAGNHDEALDDIRSRADTLALRVEQDAQERLAYEQAESRRVVEEEQRLRRNSDTMRSLAEAFCDTPFFADMSGLAIHEQWSKVVLESEPPPNPLDIDDMKFEGTCTQYLINQALYAKKVGRDSGTPEWLSFAVREGILRAKGAAPLFERIRAATPPQLPPQPTPPSEGTWSPDPVVEEPTRNPIPHCRYHDWCKEPKKKQRDQ
ncbi:MAG: hypothetical protein FD126_1881 [Elusimicrobia bacterium]|nr:MAG: hypothetical protein FD126_1881 [Elusimicrobiota bacterium]